MATDAFNNSPPSRSNFRKLVTLRDWWLTKPQTDVDRNSIGVSGLTCNPQQFQVERHFSSAPILKAYDFFELETVDSICVILQGFINKEKTLQSGFSSKVFDHFVIGFPCYWENWEEFCTSCPKKGTSDEYFSKVNEESISIGKFDDNCTMDTEVEDCKDKEEFIMKGGDERPSDVVVVKRKYKKKDGYKWLGGSTRTTRSMTKTRINRNQESDIFDKHLKADETPLGISQQYKKKFKKKEETGKKGKVTVEILTPMTTNKGEGANILSPESFSGKRSRSGRVLLPSLEYWRNQTVVYDAGLDRQVTGVRDVAS